MIAAPETKALTLADIDALFPESHDGSVYSDLYKDVNGFRPRGHTFTSVEEFSQRFDRLAAELSVQIDEEKIRHQVNQEAFKARVEETMELISGCDKERAVYIIADAEGEADDVEVYGYEHLEWRLDLGYGWIKQYIAERSQCNVDNT